MLFVRHSAPLRRWASGRLPRWARDLADTDDIVQEALLQTFKRIEEFEARGAGSLHAYLRQAVVNRIRDELRRKARLPEFAELDSHTEDAGPTPLDQVIGRDALESYERALAGLKPEEQEAIIARVEMGYTYPGTGRISWQTILGSGAQSSAARPRPSREGDGS